MEGETMPELHLPSGDPDDVKNPKVDLGQVQQDNTEIESDDPEDPTVKEIKEGFKKLFGGK
jgi:hypothetical protein